MPRREPSLTAIAESIGFRKVWKDGALPATRLSSRSPGRRKRAELAASCARVSSNGRELQQPAGASTLSIFKQPDGAVRTLLDFADAPLHIEPFRFARRVTVELDTHQ